MIVLGTRTFYNGRKSVNIWSIFYLLLKINANNPYLFVSLSTNGSIESNNFGFGDEVDVIVL